jgi:sterol desaturase/sphingolipid hydroxylase (fatty acid hydroxylase superfamily)
VLILMLAYRLAPTELQAMLNSRDTLLGSQGLWLQALAILVIGDFIGYWVHRAFHWGPLWRIHVVHHSSEDLDWLSALRFHPTNEWLARWAQACALILLGFTPIAVAVYIAFLSMYTVFLHANVSWDFGPLRAVFVSPHFHRWHHSREPEGRNRNFARLLPVFDILFGTWYMPKDQVPHCFGLNDEAVPENYFTQLLYPFRRRVAKIALVNAPESTKAPLVP